ncbi:MAG: hypothetical protein IPK83_12895 [Planctomycetes bacterium]|nr:hypothetical protein [Planctomycetota bacterium]
MTPNEATPAEREVTSVDDIRCIREQLCAEANNDVGELIELVQRIADEYRDQLKLKEVPVPSQNTHSTDE